MDVRMIYIDKGGRGCHKDAIEQYLTIDTANGGPESGGKNYHLLKEMCP